MIVDLGLGVAIGHLGSAWHGDPKGTSLGTGPGATCIGPDESVGWVQGITLEIWTRW